MRTLARRLLVGAVMAAAGLALGACGSDSSDSGSASSSTAATAATTAAPEDTIAPDAAVATGLVKLKGVGAKIAAAPDGDSAKEAADGLEPVWQPIEGTVKKNEPDLYLDVEDSFQRLESGDLDNAKTGATALTTAVDAYLAKHPG
jgi:ABC-type phosphate/phosphonate transport system substrate-binding protein